MKAGSSLCIYVDVVRGPRLIETIEMREYSDKPSYIPEKGDYLSVGRTLYCIQDRRVTFPSFPDGPDCFLTLQVVQVQEPFFKRLWERLRGRKTKRLITEL